MLMGERRETSRPYANDWYSVSPRAQHSYEIAWPKLAESKELRPLARSDEYPARRIADRMRCAVLEKSPDPEKTTLYIQSVAPGFYSDFPLTPVRANRSRQLRRQSAAVVALH